MYIISPVSAHVFPCAVMLSSQKSTVPSVPPKSHNPRVVRSGVNASSYAEPLSYVASNRPAWYFRPLFAVFFD